MSVYRTPGRTLTPLLPPPSWRTLLAPLVRPMAYVALVVAGIAAFDRFGPAVFGAGDGVRFVPTVDLVEDLLAASVLATPIVAAVLIARRVAPSWQGLRRAVKVGYVAGVLALQLLATGAAAYALVLLRLRLFEPTVQTAALAPDGRTAYVYGSGLLSCKWDVYVAPPLSLTMQKELHVPRARCDEPTPAVRWERDRTVRLVDAQGATLAPQSSPPLLLGWGGGC